MNNARNSRSALCSECMLSNICLPSVLQQHERSRFEKLSKKSVVLPPKQIIYHPNEPLKNLYIMQSGSAKSYTLSDEGEENITDFYFPGDFLGMDALHCGSYTSFAITLQTSSVCIVPLENLLLLSAEIPTVFHEIIKLLSTKLNLHIGMRSHHHAEEKVAAFLAQLSNRFKKLGQKHNEYTLSMSRQDIGHYLGLATETVSRIFTHFQKTGILELEHRHILLDETKLHNAYKLDEWKNPPH
jgi:CRP/FNR family transcriptional regulator, anaerobic regulatory protein